MSDLDVTLVVPGRNCAATLGLCLDSAVPLLGGGLLKRIIFVDDGSTDNTAAIARSYPIDVIPGEGRGPGAARNIGWRATETDLVWFVDSDCVIEPGALQILLSHLEDPQVAGVSGSYGNVSKDSLLACLIHEEIVERHLRMAGNVNFLATFNVIYRRSALLAVGGFDEHFLKAQDAELSFRIKEKVGDLKLDPTSRVGHHHPLKIRVYLKTQERQGYYRAWLYLEHPSKMKGDSYSGFWDHVQPVLALASLALVPTVLLGPAVLLQAPLMTALALAQVPMTAKILARKKDPTYGAFAALSFLRSYARGIGFARGVADVIRSKRKVG